MNNTTTRNAPRHHSEHTDVLAMQILGLISREGNGQFSPTDKALRLSATLKKQSSGDVLTNEEQVLLDECVGAI